MSTMSLYDRSIHNDAFVHRQAHLGDCTIGAGTQVWQFASIIRSAVIGKDCRIGSTAIVDGSRIGDRCIVGHGAFVGPGMLMGNDVFLGPHVSLCNDYWPRATKQGWFRIEDLCSGDIEVTHVGDGASIGANAVIMPGLTIGTGAMIAAGAVVVQDVPARHLYKRNGKVVPINRSVERKRAVKYTIAIHDPKYREAAVR